MKGFKGFARQLSQGFYRNIVGKIFRSEFFVMFIIMGCGAQKEDRAPDRTMSVSELLSSKMTIASQTDLASASTDSVSAVSQQNRGIVTTVRGSEFLQGILQDLRIGLVGNYEVRFALTPHYVVAQAVVPGDTDLTVMDKILVKSVGEHQQLIDQGKEKLNLKGIPATSKLLAIAQIKTTAEGRLRNQTNDIGEDTPLLEIVPTTFANVTYIIMGQLDTRERMLITNEQASKEVFTESALVGQIMTYEKLNKITGVKLRLENPQENLLTERSGNKLNLFRFVSKKTLTPDELNSLSTGSSILRACTDAQASVVGRDAADCVVKLSFSVPAEVVAVEREVDSEGYETGAVIVRVLQPSEASQGLIQISQNVEVAEVNPDEVLGAADERKILRPQIVGGKEYLFRRTLQDSPNGFDYAFAGLSGDLEIVKFLFEETSVKIQRSEPLLSTNGTSSVDVETLMEIPAQYVILTRKAPDGSDLPYDRVIPSTFSNPDAIALVDWSANKVPNVSSPLNYFGLENCFTSRTQSVSDVASGLANTGMLNFTVTSTYASSTIQDCAGIEMADYFDRLQTIFSFKERISFKEYIKPAIEEPSLNIPLLAQKKLGFGLFTYDKRRPNEAGENNLENTIINLPAVFDFSDGKTVTYVLAGLPDAHSTDSQALEKRKVVIDSTQKVIRDLNYALSEATKGTPAARDSDFIILKIEGQDIEAKTLGDLDRNYIYYVEKTTDSPIIGLGGSHPNPRSGRVEAASVFLYAGNMSMAIARMRKSERAEALRAAITQPIALGDQSTGGGDSGGGGDTGEGGGGVPAASAAQVAGARAAAHAAGDRAARLKLPNASLIAAKPQKLSRALSTSAQRNIQTRGKNLNQLQYMGGRLDPTSLQAKLSPRAANLSRAFETLRKEGSFAKTSFDSQARIAQVLTASLGLKAPTKALVQRVRQAQYCVYEAQPDFSDAGDGAAASDKFSDIEMLGKMWTATLAHELGHNLGLRHNFQGSLDKANWTRGEQSTRDYSSIMDYLVHDTYTYDGYGPQDIASFRAAYGEVVNTNAGDSLRIQDIPAKLGHTGWLDISKAEISRLGVKDYSFCTDEDVGFSPTCQPFDEGSTPLEIVENKIKNFKTRYALAHFPNDRAHFDAANVSAIVSRNISEFTEMRQFLEESIYQLIQGADVQSVVVPNLQGALRAMEFFQEIVRTPDASSFMDKYPFPSDFNSPTDRFVELQVNTNQGPVLLHGETQWSQDIALDEDMTRLRVAGNELNKVIALIMLTERSFGFAKYEAISLRLAYPDIEKLVYDAPTPDVLPTVSLLREILEDRVVAQVDTPLGSLSLPAAYNASTTELIRYYGAMGAMANLDVNGLESADNNSTLFRVFSEIKDVPAGLPFMTRLGAQNDLKFYAEPDNLTSFAVIAKNADTKAVIDQSAQLKSLIAQMTAVRRPEFAAQAASAEVDAPKPDLDAIRKSVSEKIAALPESVANVTIEQIEGEIDNALDTAASVDQMLAQGQSPDLMIQLEQFKNSERATQLDNPVLGVALESLFDDTVLAAPQSLANLVENSSVQPQYGTVFRNIETTSDIFMMLHPEYFR